MGMIGFAIKIIIVLIIVIMIIAYAWPYIEPLLPWVRTTTTGMATLAVEKI